MTVVTASRAFLKLFGVTSDEIVGRRPRDLDQGQWDVAALRELLEHVVPDSEAIRGFEVEDEFPGLGRRIFKLDAREISATGNQRSEEHTSELQSLMRTSYAVFCLKKNENKHL